MYITSKAKIFVIDDLSFEASSADDVYCGPDPSEPRNVNGTGTVDETAEAQEQTSGATWSHLQAQAPLWATAVACLCCDPGADGDTKRAELAFFLRGWAEGPGFAGVREHGAIEVLDSVLDVCGATPRFAVGTRVVCNAGELVHGKVVAHWWRHPQWAAGDPAAVYQVQLESNGELIFAPADVDECIKAA